MQKLLSRVSQMCLKLYLIIKGFPCVFYLKKNGKILKY